MNDTRQAPAPGVSVAVILSGKEADNETLQHVHRGQRCVEVRADAQRMIIYLPPVEVSRGDTDHARFLEKRRYRARNGDDTITSVASGGHVS